MKAFLIPLIIVIILLVGLFTDNSIMLIAGIALWIIFRFTKGREMKQQLALLKEEQAKLKQQESKEE